MILTVDCADIYGGGEGHVCEVAFGSALALKPSLRSSMQLVTKCGIVVPSQDVAVKHYDTSKEYIQRRVSESLTALQTEYLDLVLIHRPSPLMDPDHVHRLI